MLYKKYDFKFETVALDDFTIDYPYKEIIEIVDIIKVDFMLSSKEDIKKIIKK